MTSEREAQLARRVQILEQALASACIDILTSPAVTDTMWATDRENAHVTTVDDIAEALGIDTVDEYGQPTPEVLTKAGRPAAARGAR